MQEIKRRYRHSQNLWKAGLIVTVVIVLLYLLHKTLSDPRLVYMENPTLIALVSIVLISIIYMLKKKLIKKTKK